MYFTGGRSRLCIWEYLSICKQADKSGGHTRAEESIKEIKYVSVVKKSFYLIKRNFEHIV
jgi:hypothetical protein